MKINDVPYDWVHTDPAEFQGEGDLKRNHDDWKYDDLYATVIVEEK